MEYLMELIRLYLPTVVATIMTVVVPLVIKSVWNRVLTKKLNDMDRRLSASIEESNIADIRASIKCIQDDLGKIMGRPPRTGKE